jgi:hypothetical protein
MLFCNYDYSSNLLYVLLEAFDIKGLQREDIENSHVNIFIL